MQFLSMSVRGLGPFADPRDFDFESLDGSLTAVAGPNGAGKSTLLELLLAGVYRVTPTRGSLLSLAGANRDASLVVRVRTDREYECRHFLDGVAGKAEAVIYADGEPLTESGKVTQFDRVVVERFPSLDVALATQFSAQQSGGFLAAKPGDRKAILLEMLGVDHLERLATSAREEKRKLQLVASERAGALAGLQSSATVSPEQADADYSAAKSNRETLAAALNVATVSLANGREHNERGERQNRLADQLDDRRATLGAHLVRARERLAEVETSDDRFADVLAAADGIDAAAAELPGLVTAGTEAAEDVFAAQAIVDAEASAIRNREVAIAELVARRAKVAAVAEQYDSLAAAKVNRTTLFEASNSAAESHRKAVAELEALNAAQLNASSERVNALRIALRAIAKPGVATMSVDIARTALRQDNALVEDAKTFPDRRDKARARVEQLRRDGEKAFAALGDCDRVLARWDTVTEAVRDLSSIDSDIRVARDMQAGAADGHKASLDSLQAAKQLREDIRGKYVKARQVASRANLLAEARELKATRLAVEGQLRERIAELEQQLADVPPSPSRVDLVDVEALDNTRATALAAEKQADAEAWRLMERSQQAHDLHRAIGKASDELADVEGRLQVADQLGRDLGRDGLQAAVIDAALPELVTIANQLLGDSFGPRFTVDVRSQVVNSTGKRLLETLDVVVLDTESGREAKAETYSGGERAIIAEGLSLALTTIACREAGVTAPTIVRDEAGAALDEGRSRQWMAMLRQAAELIGASRVLFVSHDAGCRELADSTVQL